MPKRKIDWPIVLFIFTYQGLVLALAPFYFYYASPSWGLVVVAIFLYIATGISITAGFHRFYAHRAYKANKIVEESGRSHLHESIEIRRQKGIIFP